jgi:SAM-dependent methyltransferase
MNLRTRVAGYSVEAEFYDYCWSSFVEDIEFYKKRLGRPGHVLDLMCGTGRVALALARAGWEVDGVDQSPEMLRIARSKCGILPRGARDRVRFHRADLTGFRLPGRYDAALIAANSFPLILNRRDRIRALNNVRHHLKDPGKLIIQIDTPRSYESTRAGNPILQVFRLNNGARWYVRSLAESFVRPNLVRGLTAHMVINRSGRTEARATSETLTRVLSVSELTRELWDAGFVIGDLFGGYDGTRLTPKSTYAVIEATT